MEIKTKSPLLNKKVEVRLVDNLANTFHKNRNLRTLAPGALKTFKVPRRGLEGGGQLVNPLEGLSREEVAFLEEAVGRNLSPFLKEDNYWTSKEAKVILKKKGLTNESATIMLDLSDAMDYIRYRILLSNHRVAKNWAERGDKPGQYEAVIVDPENVESQELDFFEQKQEVNEYLTKQKKSKKKLFDLMRLYGLGGDYSKTAKWMHMQLFNLLDSRSNVRKLYEIINLGEKEITDRIFIQDAVASGIIEKYGNTYKLKGGGQIGSSLQEAIEFINSGENQATKVKINDAIDEYFKSKK